MLEGDKRRFPLGIVRDLKVPPARVMAAARVRDGQLDIGMFRAHWNKANTAFHDATARLHEKMAQVTADAPTVVATPGFAGTQAMSAASSETGSVHTDVVSTTTNGSDVALARNGNTEQVDAAPNGSGQLAEQHAKLAQLEAQVQASREAFEECLADTLRTAEEFSQASRQRQRELVSER